MPRPKRLSELEERLALHLRAEKIDFVREVRAISGRRWRCDFLIGDRLIVECEGGHWVNGRHTRGKGFEDDCAKYNSLAAKGYTVMRVTLAQIKSGQAIAWIKEIMEAQAA